LASSNPHSGASSAPGVLHAHSSSLLVSRRLPLPRRSHTSCARRWTHACGFVHSTSYTSPVTLICRVASNSAENEWWADSGNGAASRTAAAHPIVPIIVAAPKRQRALFASEYSAIALLLIQLNPAAELLVLVADELDQLLIRQEPLIDPHRP